MSKSTAKHVPPRQRRAIGRDRIFRLLDRQDASLTWIEGPPGAGKTTLATAYLRRGKRRLHWYQVTPDDAEPGSLYFHLSEMVEATCEKPPLPKYDAQQKGDHSAFARQFARLLFAHLPPRSSIIFDNAQEAAGAAFEDFLLILAEEAPDTVRIFVTSTRPLPAKFSPLLVNQRVAVVGWDILRLDEEENIELLRALGCKEEDSSLAARLTNGWPAGLVLLSSISRTDWPDIANGDARNWQSLFAYFASAVYGGMNQTARQALTRVALLPRFNMQMARDVAGDDAEGVLAEILRQRFFLDRCKDAPNRELFELHPLLRVFLLDQLKRELSENSLNELRLVAAQALISSGQIEEAFSIYVDTANVDRASELILMRAPVLLKQGRHVLLAQLLRKLPSMSEWACFWLGMALAPHEEDGARVEFERAYSGFHLLGNTAGSVAAVAAIVQGITAGWKSFKGIERWVEILDMSYDAKLSFPSPELELVAVSGILASTITVGPSRHAATAIKRLLQLTEVECDANQRVVACMLALPYLQMSGELDTGTQLINAADNVIKQGTTSEFRLATWLAWRATFHFLSHSIHNKTEQEKAIGEVCLEGARTLSERHAFEGVLFRCEWLKAENLMMQGEYHQSQVQLEAAGQWLSPSRPIDLLYFHLLKAHLSAFQGNYDHALSDILAARRLGEEASFPQCMLRPFFWSEAQIRAGLCEYQRCYEAASTAIKYAQTAYVNLHRTGVKAFQAIEAMESQSPDFDQKLTAFLGASREHRLYSTCGLLQPRLAKLCAQALAKEIEPETAKLIISKCRLVPPPSAPEAWPWQIKVSLLGSFDLKLMGTSFESNARSQTKPLELLRLLAAHGEVAYSGIAVRRIAEDLWPDSDAEDPRGNFDTTLHRLRKLIGCDDALVLADGRLALNRELVWCDTAALERLTESDTDDVVAQSSLLLGLYKGPLVEGDGLWSTRLRERFKAMFVRAVLRWGSQLEELGQDDLALNLYELGLIQDNLVEPFYRGQIRIQLRKGAKSEALLSYRRCKELLSIVLGVTPSQETELLHGQIHGLALRVVRG